MSNRLAGLLARIHVVRLQQKEIAEESGLNETTICRVLGGGSDPLNSTLDKIEKVVEAREDKVRRLLPPDPNKTEAA